MSTFDNQTDFGKTLTFVASVPLMWNVVEQADAKKFSVDNEQYLRTILNLSEFHSRDVAEEIAALERKVDITLEMVATLLRSSIDMPSTKKIKLGAYEISWQQSSPLPDLGAELDIVVHLHELYPKPLILTGQVKSVIEQECFVELVTQTAEVQQLLEKFIFLHHRRVIAQAKLS